MKKDLFENLNEPKPLKTKKVAKKEALREIESNQPNKKIEDKLPTSPPEITSIIFKQNLEFQLILSSRSGENCVQ